MTGRRDFMRGAGAFAACSGLGGCGTFASLSSFEYENNLRDRCWAWGHDTGQVDGEKSGWGLDVGKVDYPIAEGARFLGCPNIKVIRWGVPDESYIEQFRDARRVTWLLGQDTKALKQNGEFAFSLVNKMPNLMGLDIDDYLSGKNDMVSQVPNLRKRIDSCGRKIELHAVLYTMQLNDPRVVPAMEAVDVVSLWTWRAPDLAKLRENFRRYRELLPNKRTLLGIYLYDFGRHLQMPVAAMESQLADALALYKEGEIEGFVFLCTSIFNRSFPTIALTRDWIRRHADESR